MTRIKSEQYFHAKPENYNCAQAILKGFQQELNISENLIEEFKAFGGGRAPESACGAIFAVDFLLKRESKESLKLEFIEKVGAFSCRDIKAHNNVPCMQCVKVADELLAQELDK